MDGTSESVALFGHEGKFSFPKPEALLSELIACCTKPGDLVLDSFAGSGTTGAVAHKMGRRWIMVELGEHCHTHIIPRMKKVIDGQDPGGISEAVGWKRGGGFRYYRLAETLLVRDRDLSANRHPVYIINPRYDERMLIRAICKIEGFRYRNEGRLHGISSESRFLHVTTLLLTQAYLDSLSEDVGAEQSLLIYCTRRRRGLDVPDNAEIKRIPRDLLTKCDFQEDR
jgi:adenine-specific DNA-methyltransferase